MDTSDMTDSGIDLSTLNYPLSSSFLRMLDDDGEGVEEGKSPNNRLK
jgi:hypothetical protein